MATRGALLRRLAVFAVLAPGGIASSQAEVPPPFAGPPLRFVENRGQWDGPARFVCARAALTAHFERRAMVLDFRGESDGVVVRMAFEGAADGARVEGLEPQPGANHYFSGSDPAAYHTDVPAYGKLAYTGLYDGVDVQVRAGLGSLEYDVLLDPCAPLDDVVIRCEGVAGLRLDEDGTLVLETDLGPIRQAPPTTWEELESGARRPVACRYRLLGGDRFGFEAPERDPDLPLVVDPGLVWSSYLGGSSADRAHQVDVGPDGRVTVAGYTGSSGFPSTTGAYSTSYGPVRDGFISRFSADGTTLEWSTFFAGAGVGINWIFDMEVDAAGDVVVGGVTAAGTFPTTVGAFQTTFGGLRDAFVSKISADGSTLLYSTFLGGSGEEWVLSLDVDASGAVTVIGPTSSDPDFPTTPGAYDTTYNGGTLDAFVARLNMAGGGASDLVWSTYLGGSDEEGDPYQYSNSIGMHELFVAVDDFSGAVSIAGRTVSTDFPVTFGAYDTTYNGGTADVFVGLMDPTGTFLVWASYLGGTENEGRAALARDRFGNPVIAGFTSSPDWPTTVGSHTPVDPSAAVTDAYVAKLSIDGTQLLYSTYLGASGSSAAEKVAVDSAGTVIVGGQAFSSDFPTTAGAYSQTHGSSAIDDDAFLARLRTGGNGVDDLQYSTFLGGGDFDVVMGIDWDEVSSATIAGVTDSINFPTVAGSYDTTWNGSTEAYVARIEMLPTGASIYGNSTPGCFGPLAIGVDSIPQVGNGKFSVTCTNAPPNTVGFFVVTPNKLDPPALVLGMEAWIDPAVLTVFQTPTSDAFGYAEGQVPIPVVPALAGLDFFSQFFWPSVCGPQGFSASNALELIIQ